MATRWVELAGAAGLGAIAVLLVGAAASRQPLFAESGKGNPVVVPAAVPERPPVVVGMAEAGKLLTRTEGEHLLETMETVVGQTGNWSRWPLQERLNAISQARAVVDIVDQRLSTGGIKNPQAQCRNAAIAMKFYVLNLNDLALLQERRSEASVAATLFPPSFNAFDFGKAFEVCRTVIEAMPEEDGVAPKASQMKP